MRANAPSLKDLYAIVPIGHEGDCTAFLALLLDALPHNTHLRTLDVRRSRMPEAFRRDVMAPAAAAFKARGGVLRCDEDDSG